MTERAIVVADAQPHFRLLIEQSLQELTALGVEVIAVGDGQIALEMIRSKHPRLVITDVLLPGMNGYELCETAKSEQPDVFVVILTDRGQAHERQRAKQVGADLYVTKPFDPDELLAKAREITN